MNDITTCIATSDVTSITVRGRDLVNDLIGKHSYTEMVYFLIRGRMPTANETKILDACLITLMEHSDAGLDDCPSRRRQRAQPGSSRHRGRVAGDRRCFRRHDGGMRADPGGRHRCT